MDDTHGYMCIYGYAWVHTDGPTTDILGYAQVHKGTYEYTRVQTGTHGCKWVHMGTRIYMDTHRYNRGQILDRFTAEVIHAEYTIQSTQLDKSINYYSWAEPNI